MAGAVIAFFFCSSEFLPPDAETVEKELVLCSTHSEQIRVYERTDHLGDRQRYSFNQRSSLQCLLQYMERNQQKGNFNAA